MRTNHHATSVAMTLAFLVTSCMPVPPFTTPVSPEVTGRVLDARSKKPIKGALIQTERAGYTRQAYTLDDGRFTVPSASQWHYLVYLGSPGIYPTPWMFNRSNKDLIMKVEASGYNLKSEVFYMKDNGMIIKNGWDVDLPDRLEVTLDPQ